MKRFFKFFYIFKGPEGFWSGGMDFCSVCIWRESVGSNFLGVMNKQLWGHWDGQRTYPDFWCWYGAPINIIARRLVALPDGSTRTVEEQNVEVICSGPTDLLRKSERELMEFVKGYNIKCGEEDY
jgi:hypothetical protein